MNDFEKRLKVEGITGKYKPTQSTVNIDDKIRDAVFSAIESVKTKSIDEDIRKIDMLRNVNQFLANYDDSMKVLLENQRREREDIRNREIYK